MHDQFSLRLSPGAGWPRAEDTELIEFMDKEGRLLLVAPKPEAERLGLRHKLVAVALRLDGGRFVIRRRSSAAWSGARLDLSGVASVRPGEAWEDAALRSLGLSASVLGAGKPDAPLQNEQNPAPRLAQVASFTLDEPPRRQVLVYLATQKRRFLPADFCRAGDSAGPNASGGPGSPGSPGSPGGMSEPDEPNEALLLDRDELEGLAAQSPELLTQGLLWTLRSGCLWSGAKPRAALDIHVQL